VVWKAWTNGTLAASPKHRNGARIGHDVVKDSLYLDGLEDAYTPGKNSWVPLPKTPYATFGITRSDQD